MLREDYIQVGSLISCEKSNLHSILGIVISLVAHEERDEFFNVYWLDENRIFTSHYNLLYDGTFTVLVK